MDKREREGGRREGGRRKGGWKDRRGRTTNQSFGNNLHRVKLTIATPATPWVAKRNARCNWTSKTKYKKTSNQQPQRHPAAPPPATRRRRSKEPNQAWLYPTTAMPISSVHLLAVYSQLCPTEPQALIAATYPFAPRKLVETVWHRLRPAQTRFTLSLVCLQLPVIPPRANLNAA